MKDQIWKYLFLMIFAANVIYWLLIAPAWNWKTMVEANLAEIGRIIAEEHPGQVQQRRPQQPPPPVEEESQ